MGLGKKLRSQFLTGIIIILPIGVTIWLLVWFFTSIDNILQPLVSSIIGRTILGLGFINNDSIGLPGWSNS